MDNPNIDNARSVKNPSPFITFTTRTIPATFDTSMSYQEALFALVNYLQTQVTPAINENAGITNEQTKAINELYDFVNHYFDNIDVQEEINNKLDEMAESGELAEIIAQYANLGCVFGYHTIADMASASNLKSGSIVKVLGKTNDNTGDGSYYKIRTRTNADEPDGVNIVVIQDTENLVAQIIPNYFINQEALARQSADTNLQNQIDNLVTPPRKYIFVGDSYGDGYNPDGNVEGWGSRLATILGLESGDYINTHLGGMGFSRPAEYNYYTLINALTSDDEVTDILIAGSYNDKSATETAILEGITAVKNLCASKFPNAKLHIAFIGWSSNGSAKTELIQCYRYYKNACDSFLDIDFMENTQYILHQYFTDFASDGIHPTNAGQAKIAKYLAQSLIDGKCNIAFNGGLNFTPVSSGSLSGTWTTGTQINNDTTTAFFNGTGTMQWSAGNYVTITGKAITKLADLTSGVMVGTSNESCSTSCMCVTQTSDNKYHSLPCQIIIKDKGLYIRPCLINSTATNYDTQELKLIQFGAINITINSMYA